MKRIICFLVALACVASSFTFCAAAEGFFPSVSGKSAILIDSDGKILYEKNSFVCLPMASTTKIMTCIVALENARLTDTVKITRESVGVEGSSVYLREGEIFTVEELLYALMLSSANDAAVSLAIHVGKSEENFVSLMNRKAKEIGLSNTHFESPHGLDHENHYTTAYDLARLMAYALKNESFCRISSTVKTEIRGALDNARYLVNHNRLLRTYEGMIGGKTGYTKKSGRCLVTAAQRDGLTLIAVTLSASDDWNDHKKLLDYGFSYYESTVLCETNQSFYNLNVVGGNTVRCVASEKASLSLPKGKSERLRYVVELPRFLWEMPDENERVGRVVFYIEDKAFCVDLIAKR